MTITLSSKGQIVVPPAARRRLGLHAGQKLSLQIRGDELVLTPAPARMGKYRSHRSKATGSLVITAPADLPPLDSAAVRAALADFP
jgi:AbrB family looped-hinge helix DNA binding protein